MAKVSVIIVSYNVKKFLQLCLNSVFNSDAEVEVIVVDNLSQDGTSEMIIAEYADVIFLPQNQNLGFGKACNIGLDNATGEYILFLNPDTVIQEDTISNCIRFYNEAETPGIVGVKMIDGSGNYLPESKRGFPDMMSSFWKMSGISSLFPRSQFFNHYYLGHLSSDHNAEVDILCGAFMFLHVDVIDKAGNFDEAFFMYGEDIDLSYRVQQAGYRNYYLADTKIIHYKGQSTKKENLRYVNHFYNAMAIFSNKHFRNQSGRWLIFLLGFAIQFRKGVSIVKRLGSIIWLPILEGLLFVVGFNIIQKSWGEFYFGRAEYYESSPILFLISTYTLVWISVMGWNKMYAHRTQYNRSSAFLSTALGTLIILIGYSLLPESYRTSRALIGLFSAYVLVASYLLRTLILRIIAPSPHPKRIGFAGSVSQYDSFYNLMSDHRNNPSYVYHIVEDELSNMDDIKHIHQLDEIVFSFKDLKLNTILDTMTKIDNVDFKIYGSESLAAIGSKAKSIPGESYSHEISYAITEERSIATKRIFDMGVGVILLVFAPVLSLFMQSSFVQVISGLFSVVRGGRTLVGYNSLDTDIHVLPTLRPGLIEIGIEHKVNNKMYHQFNADYAMYYTVLTDLQILIKQWRSI